jgi:hypothetical protein
MRLTRAGGLALSVVLLLDRKLACVAVDDVEIDAVLIIDANLFDVQRLSRVFADVRARHFDQLVSLREG